MAERNWAPNMALFMNGPQEIQKSGRISSVCLHPTRDLVVSLHEDSIWNMGYCSVFNVSRQVVGKISTDLAQFNSGKHFSVAVVYTEENKGIAIAVYRCILFKDIYYRIGFVNVNDHKVDWQCNTVLDKGVKPKISASKNGTVAVIYEKAYSIEKLKFQIGTISKSSAVPTVDWKLTVINDIYGVEPNIAINDDTIVIICRTGLQTLQTKVGTIYADHDINWGATLALSSTGINPTISINTRGYIIEIHQTKTLRHLTRNCGKILPNKTIAWSEPSTYTEGEFPTVSINDENFVFEMHKSIFGWKLFHSQGELRVTESQPAQESQKK